MKKAFLSPIGLVAGTISALLIVWPATRYAVALWEPFTAETVSVDIWVPPGAKVLNELGPVKVTEARIQAPTVIRVKDREAFLVGAAKSDRTEVTFMPGKTSDGSNSSVSCVDVCYVAHGRETSYLYWEAPLAPTGKDRRGTTSGDQFAFASPGTLLWVTKEHSSDMRTVACVGIALGSAVASFIVFLLTLGVWTAVREGIKEWEASRKPPTVPA